MPYATDTDLTVRIPATLTASAQQRGFALDDAEALIDDVVFGDITVRAHVLLAAHLLAASGAIPGADTGLVSARSAGEISVTYATTAWSDPVFTTTTYGRQFLEIAARVGHQVIAVPS